jgi:hypothetical protein
MQRALVTSLVLAAALGACDSVTVDDSRPDNRLFQPRGVVRGTLTYQGPRPCSKNGHIVGSAILLVFDRRNPPPPAGLANTAINFATVPGDVLFPNEPRNTTADVYCPQSDAIAAAATFDIAPLDAGSYLIVAFYDTTGNFLPTFKFRNLPERGDVGGGYLDTQDAAKHIGVPSYQPIFLPVDVGVPDGPPPPGAGADYVPRFTMPKEGFVREGIPVLVAAQLPLTRPYFYPEGANAVDPNLSPVVTMAQDHHVLAQPKDLLPNLIRQFQASFKALRLNWGVAPDEIQPATAPENPFHLQIAPAPVGGLFAWIAGPSIPETLGQNPTVFQMWPLVVLAKLDTDADGNGLVAQGGAEKPIVVIQALTLWADDLIATSSIVDTPPPAAPGRIDHLTALVRPTVICFDPRTIDRGGVLVTPYLTGKDPGDPTGPDVPLFKPDVLKQAAGKLIREVKRGCLPTGKYGMNLVYPTGQAWTVPNELGGCATAEGGWDTSINPSSCASKARPVLQSQGVRAVLEIVAATTPEGQTLCAKDAPVPPECTANAP